MESRLEDLYSDVRVVDHAGRAKFLADHLGKLRSREACREDRLFEQRHVNQARLTDAIRSREFRCVQNVNV